MVLLFLRRRRRRQPPKSSEEIESVNGGDGGRRSKADHHQHIAEADGQAVSEADGKAMRPWSMSELEGSAVVPNLGRHPGDAEVVSGDVHGGLGRVNEEKPSPVAELPGSTSFGDGNPGGPGQGEQLSSPQGREEEQQIPPFPRWGQAWRKRSR